MGGAGVQIAAKAGCWQIGHEEAGPGANVRRLASAVSPVSTTRERVETFDAFATRCRVVLGSVNASKNSKRCDQRPDRHKLAACGHDQKSWQIVPTRKKEGLRRREQAPCDTSTLPAPRTLGKDSMNPLRGDCGPWNSRCDFLDDERSCYRDSLRFMVSNMFLADPAGRNSRGCEALLYSGAGVMTGSSVALSVL